MISDFIAGNVLDFIEKHTRIFDEYFCGSFERSSIGQDMNISKNPYAIVAMGGYGRGEQCLFSDIDILLLFDKKIPAEAEKLIGETFYPLWDIGMDVAHATMTVSESVKLASTDFETMISMLDSRFVCGKSDVYFELRERLRVKINSFQKKKLISRLINTSKERHLRFGDSSYLLEPNLKDGQGGLRDYHAILWVARIRSDLVSPKELESNGYFSQHEFEGLISALKYLWGIRCRLHCMAQRKCDQLYFEYQIQMAKDLNTENADGKKSVEVFLGDLHSRMEFIKQLHLMVMAEIGNTRKFDLKGIFKGKTGGKKGLIFLRGMLFFSSSEAIVKEPFLLAEIFKKSSEFRIPISAEARRIIEDFSYLIDDDFRFNPKVINAFEYVLTTPESEVNGLGDMLSSGFLGSFIPEFKNIINRIQYDQYHIYPVARHSLHTVLAIKKFENRESSGYDSLYHTIYRELSKKRRILLWAALLHDIGKGDHGKGHSARGAAIAGEILLRMGFDTDFIEPITFLVKEHLFLIKIATRRDVNDEETSILCARKIKDIDLLKMLYLLTVADSKSTGPTAWNDWTEVLLQDLFLKVLNQLKTGELANSKMLQDLEEKKKEVFSLTHEKYPSWDWEKNFESMSPRYLLHTSSKDIVAHMGLFAQLGNDEMVMDVAEEGGADIRTVTLCARGTPGLFSKISGVFALNGLDIFDARIYTWKKNIVLDIFRVTPPKDRIFEKRKWARVKENLKDAIMGRLDLDAALKESTSFHKGKKLPGLESAARVVVDNSSSSFFTIIEVFANDFTGLLFKITNLLYKNDLDVRVAKISTKVDQAVDVFYVRDIDGQKIDDEKKVETLVRAIRDVIG